MFTSIEQGLDVYKRFLKFYLPVITAYLGFDAPYVWDGELGGLLNAERGTECFVLYKQFEAMRAVLGFSDEEGQKIHQECLKGLG